MTNDMRRLLLVVFGMLSCALTRAAVAEEFSGTLLTESGVRPAQTIPFWVSPQRLRLDIVQPLPMSVVWNFGERKNMLMISHEEQVYVQWDELQLQSARRLMQQPHRRSQQEVSGVLEFEPTGLSKVIDRFQASEARLAGADQDARVWVSDEMATGLAEFFAHYAAALNATTQFPMIGGDNDSLGLNEGVALPLAHLANASGLDGGVLRIESAPARGGAASVSISLQDLDVGKVPGDVFEAPAGYERRAQLFTGEL